MKELEKIIKYSKLIIDRNFDDCLKIAFNEYIDKYNNDIIQILTNNPLDSLNEDWTKFWNANKKAPIPLPFDIDNELIILYIKKCAEMLANSVSIQIIDDNNYIKLKCKDFKTEEFTPIKAKSKKKNRYLKNVDNIEDKKLLKKKRAEEIEARSKKKKEMLEQLKQTADKIHFPENN